VLVGEVVGLHTDPGGAEFASVRPDRGGRGGATTTVPVDQLTLPPPPLGRACLRAPRPGCFAVRPAAGRDKVVVRYIGADRKGWATPRQRGVPSAEHFRVPCDRRSANCLVKE
jgi:hypothetical protein